MSTTLDTTPANDEFHMPGEFEAHDGCWMLWPERPSNWRLGAKPAQKAFAAVATAIATGERVTVGVSRAQFTQARAMLPDAVRVVEMSSDDAWMRDVGPTFVVNRRGELRGVDWVFNAWGGINGGLYFPWDQDDLVARKVLEIEGCDRSGDVMRVDRRQRFGVLLRSDGTDDEVGHEKGRAPEGNAARSYPFWMRDSIRGCRRAGAASGTG